MNASSYVARPDCDPKLILDWKEEGRSALSALANVDSDVDILFQSVRSLACVHIPENRHERFEQELRQVYHSARAVTADCPGDCEFMAKNAQHHLSTFGNQWRNWFPDCDLDVSDVEPNLQNQLQPDPKTEFEFIPEGNGYTIRGFGESGHLANLKGLHDIAKLIRTPGIPVHMGELDGVTQANEREKRSEQPVYDPEGMKRIGDRMRRLQEEIDTADNDVEREDSERELNKLRKAFNADVFRGKGNKGGKSKVRDLNSPYDLLRSKIYDRLKTVYEKMRRAVPSMKQLASHFEQSIHAHESVSYVYRPDSVFTWNTEKK